MPEPSDLSYYSSLFQAVTEGLKQYGPCHAGELCTKMCRGGIAYMGISGEDHEVPIDDVQRVLQHGDNFVQDDTGRYHLSSETTK